MPISGETKIHLVHVSLLVQNIIFSEKLMIDSYYTLPPFQISDSLQLSGLPIFFFLGGGYAIRGFSIFNKILSSESEAMYSGRTAFATLPTK
jgi:hypothetical protein